MSSDSIAVGTIIMTIIAVLALCFEIIKTEGIETDAKVGACIFVLFICYTVIAHYSIFTRFRDMSEKIKKLEEMNNFK